MAQLLSPLHRGSVRPEPLALLQLTKPITWFPPMWAFGCGAVSAGVPLGDQALTLALGLVLVGPMVCGASQVVNDWYDREVDAINEPGRPIPSGRVPGQWGLYFAVVWTALALLVAIALGGWVVLATALGLVLAWQYSAPPLRLKRNGWWGNAAVGISYEGLAWVTGAAVLLGGALPRPEVLWLAALYSLGAHGIMTLNDFKSVRGDRCMGIRSLPARYGEARAAVIACVVMVLPQLAVVALLWRWQAAAMAALVALLVLLQLLAMPRLLRQPMAMAPWYNGVGVTLYVLGMLASAVALRGLPL
jgi:chlorophyll/bacteriochlorophyll a synthase